MINISLSLSSGEAFRKGAKFVTGVNFIGDNGVLPMMNLVQEVGGNKKKKAHKRKKIKWFYCYHKQAFQPLGVTHTNESHA